ncbi:PD-(D/E)XK nuclease superfamily protein [Pedococcus cremeus]|uniref:PD-(D/E)XK nuclease superfamily protein n=1 Tax=Pedococcus cremeus TaxID=587636 RepID=A0A1H9QKC8_9MICO|nr:PD-(D/E)XK nuclease family protein [Pedococcus cremeus]SER61021.1 PD-(D/E)XK nuclease superfamily protein [Pedococcus cremeus]
MWITPRPAPLNAASPSLLSALETCPKKAGYQQDSETRGWSRPSTRTALGIAAHAFTERTLQGSPARGVSLDDWLTQMWTLVVEEQRDKLRQRWPGREVPLPTSWPGYASTKVRLIRSLKRRYQSGQISNGAPGTARPVPTPRVSVGGHPPLPWVERRLEDPDTGLFGYPDRVEEVDGRLRVVDLKAGVHQGSMTSGQLRQLLIYAHLVRVALGRLPHEVVIVDVKGAEEQTSVCEEMVAQTIAKACSDVAMFNNAIESQMIPASPSSESCRWCDFRVLCEDYWEARADDWNVRGDLVGEAVSVTSGHELQLALDSQDGAAPYRLVLPSTRDIRSGDYVVAVGCESSGFNTSRARWNSLVRVVNDRSGD